jgi:hypothetical protein
MEKSDLRGRIIHNCYLLLFAIKMATLPFWAEIKNLRSRSRKAHKFFSSGWIDQILSDS